MIIQENDKDLSEAKKNNVAYRTAIATRQDVEKYGNLSVPLHLLNAPTKLMKELQYGVWYKYAHDYPDAQVDQEHFPSELTGTKYLS